MELFFLKRELTLSLFIAFLERKQIDRLRQTDRNTLIDACFLQKKMKSKAHFNIRKAQIGRKTAENVLFFFYSLDAKFVANFLHSIL